MKFRVKYADQIVGFFSILAMVSLVMLIFAIGVKQNWFTKKNYYFTVFDSGNGISVGMDLTYKGFSIGKVSSVSLSGDFVRVDYYVLEDYFDYVREHSIVNLDVSPIGLGSSFTLCPGTGRNIIPSNSEIYRLDSDSARSLISDGLVHLNDTSDSVSVLLGKVSIILDDVHDLLWVLSDAVEGNGDSPLTDIIGNLNKLSVMFADSKRGAMAGIVGESVYKNLEQTLAALNSMMNDSKGAVPRLLGTELSTELNSILSGLVPIIANADTIVGNATPEVGELFVQINALLLQLQDLVTGLNNNPLLRGGIPDRSNEKSATVNIRSSDF